MSSRLTILSTKKLKPAVISEAEKYGIAILNCNFIQTDIYVTPALTDAIEKSNNDIVFTSSNAVEGYLKNIRSRTVPGTEKRIFCLQGETLTAAEALPDSFIGGKAKDAESLAEVIISQQDASCVSFFCGNIRRDVLPERLKANNIRVVEIEVYETTEIGKRIKESYDAVVFFSPSAAEAFFKTNMLSQNIPCFCIGRTTASSVRSHTHNHIIVSADTSQQSVLESIIEHYNLIKIKDK